MSLPDDYPIIVEQPVQWGDMDAYQHVNNTVYLRWFETGRAAYFSRAGLWTPGAPSGVGPIFASVSCRYRAPVTYPDVVEIGVCVTELRADRYIMEHAVYSRKLGRVVASGEGVIVSYDYPAAHKVDLPALWREAIASLEAGPRRRFSSPSSEQA